MQMTVFNTLNEKIDFGDSWFDEGDLLQKLSQILLNGYRIRREAFAIYSAKVKEHAVVKVRKS